MKLIRQLGREDWVFAGAKALAEGGHKALRVERVARELSVTKGSFYWHFQDRDSWAEAVLAYWEHLAFAQLVRAKGARRSAGNNQGLPLDALDRAVGDWARRDVVAALTWMRVRREREMTLGLSAQRPEAA